MPLAKLQFLPSVCSQNMMWDYKIIVQEEAEVVSYLVQHLELIYKRHAVKLFNILN